MATTPPIHLKSVMDLAAMGINSQSFKFGFLTMESDHYICIKELSNNSTAAQVVVIDMKNNNSMTRKPMKAEACLMNPTENMMALKGKTDGQAGHYIQVFNLDTKTKLCVHEFSEPVILWKWLDSKMMGIVTEKSVYHWSIEGKVAPTKIFDRQGKLAESATQLINYATDADKRWCLLVGISTQDQGKTIDGSMQLYSVEKQQQQMLEGHSGCFFSLIVDEAKGPINVFSFAEKRRDGQSKLHVMDIYSPKSEGSPAPFKVSTEIRYPTEAANDFPVAMHASRKHGVTYMVSKAGYLFLFDSFSGTMLYRHRVSQETIFISCENQTNGGVIFVTRKGQVMTATVNEDTIIPYIQNALTDVANRQGIAAGLARKYGLPGADEILVNQFNQAFATGNYKSAARIVAIMKSGALRTPQTIQQFKQAHPAPGSSEPSPILQYFSTLLEHVKLNKFESTELVRPVVAQGRREFIEKWLKDDMLECSEELGDIIKGLDAQLAETVYVKAAASAKVIQSLVEQGRYDQIVAYAKRVNYNQVDYSFILKKMMAQIATSGGNVEAAVQFAKQLLDNEPPLMDINQVIEIMLQQRRLQELTSILLEYLKGNKLEEGHLQTRLMEINLAHAPQVAETIFQMELFSHYDRHRVAVLCEKAGLYQRALEHYSDVTDIKRVMIHTGGNISAEWMQQFFGKMAPEVCLEILSDMMRNSRNQQQTLQTVVQMAIKFSERIGNERLIAMFESFNSWEGIFYYLGAIIALSQDPDVHFKYIEAAAKLGNTQEVERVCRESKIYDPVVVKEFLKQIQLTDPRPLIYVCDLHGYVGELAEYLYKNNLMKYIEVYVAKVNPSHAPLVVGTLLDLDCTEDFIKSLLNSVRGACPVIQLVEQVEKRNRLRLLLPWLEARMSEGNNEAELHNAVAKIFIDTNRDAENFLRNNQYYDSKVVGLYCEDRDPHLAYTAYRRAWGSCDDELVNVTNINGLYRLQARYLVERQSSELWAKVLTKDSDHRRPVIDQVVSTALPESTNPEEVSATVKAFISADLPNELIELLEKIVLHNSDFSSNKNLQNLLVLTAVKADKTRVMDYINRLSHYDGPEIAEIALQYGLHEEAFVIFKKFDLHSHAVSTLLNETKDIGRATDFAARCDDTSVWSQLANALLEQNRVPEAIDWFLKAEDATAYKRVIEKGSENGCYEELSSFLQMARKAGNVKDQLIDTELVYALAKAQRLSDMEEFIMGSNTANVQGIGDRLFDESDFEAAKILFGSIPNNSKLANCYMKLCDFNAAVDAARKAKNPTTWKHLNYYALEANDKKNAHIAGLALVAHPDHLEDLILQYENRMLIEELTELLEAGIVQENASHVGLYTELAIVYAKFNPSRLMEFCRSVPVSVKAHQASSHSVTVATTKLNIPKVIKACEESMLWREAVFLHISYDEYDQAANTMIQHSPSAWNHEEFLQVIQKASNSELYYRAVAFYLEYHPTQVNNLLKAIEKKIDHGRVVHQVRKAGHLGLIQPYMEHIQTQNVSAVNEALCELYVESEDYGALRGLVLGNDNFDQLGLASKLEKHEMIEMRRIAYALYTANKKFKKSVELSKADSNFCDAMQTARESGSPQIVEDLLRYFVEIGDKERFAACLYVCYELVRPEMAMELAWMHGYMDQAMPYMIQTMKDYSQKVDALMKKVGDRESEEKKLKSAPNDFVPDYMMGTNAGLTGLGNLALPPVNGSVQAGLSQPNTSFQTSPGLSGFTLGMGSTNGAPL